MRVCLLLALAVSAFAAEDAHEIVRRSVEADLKQWDLIRQYAFQERSETRQLDSKGSVKDRESRTWDVMLIDGSPHRRLIARNDKPLPPQEESKEQERQRNHTTWRKAENPELRKARMEDTRRRQEKQRAPIKELPDAFDFRLVGEEKIGGMEVWVIEGTPRKGFKPQASMAHFFPKVKGRLWIAKKDYQWVRVEGESVETIAFGAILARVAKGATIRIEQVRVNDEVWMPKRIDIAANARIALIKMFRGQMELTYDKYRKFHAEPAQ